MPLGIAAVLRSPRRGRLAAVSFALLLAGALTARVLWVRREIPRRTAPQLAGALAVTRAGVGAWARTYTAQAELLARLAAQEPALQDGDGPGGAAGRAAFARRFGPGLAALTRADGVVGAWVYDARGHALAGWPPAGAGAAPPAPRGGAAPVPARPRDDAPAAVPARAAGGAVVRTERRPGGVWVDVVAPVAGDGPVPGGVPVGTVVVRVAVDDASLPALNPTRPENRSARTTLLTRLGDSVVVVATASNESVAVPRRGFALREVPPHVRAALDGRPAEGTGRGLFRPRVVHAAAPLPELGWAMVREVDADWLLGQYTTAIVVEETVFATIAVLAAFLVVSRVRAVRARRDGALAQLRADFVSGVSHELRTPLAQIRMFAELLRKRALRDEEDAERALRIIEKEAGRLTILVDNVLNYARLRREPATVRWITPVPADVAAEARQVLESFAPLAAERGARLALDVEEGPRAVIDPQALRQVLLNFLENAVKYGPRGGTVTLGARAAPAAAPAGATRPAAVPRARVRIWVDDEGPGVPPAERERVWEAFHRSEAAVRSGVGGSGLGLAVVRDLVAHAGGTVRVESAPGGGARFVAELPMVGPVTA